MNDSGRTCRPRTSHAARNRLLAIASRMNGEEVTRYHRALSLLLRYFDLLNGDAQCPECEGQLGPYKTQHGGPIKGKYRCHGECTEDETDRGLDDVHTIWDVLEVDDPEEASLPAAPADVERQLRQSLEGGTDEPESASVRRGPPGRNSGNPLF